MGRPRKASPASKKASHALWWAKVSVGAAVLLAAAAYVSSRNTSEGQPPAPRNLNDALHGDVGEFPPGRRHQKYAGSGVTEKLPPPLRWEVVGSYHHDNQAFTQGLEFQDGYLWESTGLTRSSTMRQVEMRSGAVVKKVHNSNTEFGEGLTRVNDTLLQLTWRNKILIKYAYPSLERLGYVEFKSHKNNEGWGICFDGTRLIVSDGSQYLTFIDPHTLVQTHQLKVTDPRRPGVNILDINELECVEGEVLANVWHSTNILRIDPDTGTVIGTLDMKTLYPAPVLANREHCLNGIAYDAAGSTDNYRRLYITGKQWDKLFEVLWYP